MDMRNPRGTDIMATTTSRSAPETVPDARGVARRGLLSRAFAVGRP